VRSAGTAEALLGAGRGADDFVFIAVGTGIAAAIVTAGRTVTGVGRAAGEVGHMPVHPGGKRCSCGQRGCLEAYASGLAITRRYRELGGRRARTAEKMVDLLGVDPIADAAWSDAVEALSLGLSAITMTLDPALIVLGGGLARAGDTLLAPLRTALTELLVWRRPPAIMLSQLGSQAGRIGAGMHAFRTLGYAAVTDSWTSAFALQADAMARP
jgi:glucokinase